METTKGKIIVGLLAVVVGLIIATQVRFAQGGDLGALVPVSKVKAYEAELKAAQTVRAEAAAQLEKAEKELAELKESQAEADYYIKGLMSDLEKYKNLAGVTEVQGSGIIITIEDPAGTEALSKESSIIMYNYDLLLSLINKLREADAEAIAVNQQRIIASTEISLAGTNVNINGVPTAPPYEIKAIGNSTLLESALTIRFGIVDQMRSKYNLKVTIERSEELIVPRYGGTIVFNYATPIEDSDAGTDSESR